MSVNNSVSDNSVNSLVSIDLGFLYTKAIVNGQRLPLIKSVVGSGKHLRFDDLNMSSEEKIITKLNNSDYFVSDFAIRQSDTIDHSLKPNRFNRNATQILVDTIYGIGLQNGMHHVNIVSGLPASHYNKHKDEITTLFMGLNQKQHSFNVVHNNNSISGSVQTIEGRFIPQPFGVYLDILLDDSGEIVNRDVAKQTVSIVDIGFGTSDIYTMNALEPIDSLTFSSPTAMHHAYTMIASKIEESFGILYPLYKIDKIVQTKRFEINNKTFDMSPVISWAFQMTANQLVTEITNKIKNMWEINLFVVAGGGGKLLYNYVKEEFPNIILVDDPQWSVVNGYNKWGIRSWQNDTISV